LVKASTISSSALVVDEGVGVETNGPSENKCILGNGNNPFAQYIRRDAAKIDSVDHDCSGLNVEES
jgi:hypothetical protein